MLGRLHEIREILYTKKQVYTNELAEYYNVSTVSIRKDLGILEQEGILTRVYGGGVLREDKTKKPAFLTQSEYPTLEKIAARACEEIEDGDIIFLGSGRTCCLLAKMLHKFKHLSVVTNNIGALDDLLRAGSKIYLIGGEVTSTDGISLFSSPEDPKNFINHIRVNKAFTSASALDFVEGLTVTSVVSTYIYKYIPTISKNWYMMLDSSKFDKLNMYPVATLDQIDYLITDTISQEHQDKCEESHVVVYKVGDHAIVESEENEQII